MATLADSIPSSNIDSKILPFDVHQHMKSVADLIELCFLDTLDPDGKRYLQQMRFAADNPRYLNWASSTVDWISLPMNGFVCFDKERLVGNLSLIPIQTQGQRNYLIANVAVHPEFRRRGIARQMTLKALEYAKQRSAPSVWLHVRTENNAAVNLYRELGFAERARRTTWFSHTDYRPVASAHEIKIRPRLSEAWNLQQSWLRHYYPTELAWHFSLNFKQLRPGWLASLERFFHPFTIRQWTAYRGEKMSGALTIQSTRSHADSIWLAPPPDGDDASVLALLNAARQALPRRRSLTLDFPADSAIQAIREAGFLPHQTLIWMQIRFPKFFD